MKSFLKRMGAFKKVIIQTISFKKSYQKLFLYIMISENIKNGTEEPKELFPGIFE